MDQSSMMNYLNPALLATVAFFLSQLVKSVKGMERDISEIKITISSHAEKVEDISDRVAKLEDKCDRYDVNIREFYLKYSHKLNDQ